MQYELWTDLQERNLLDRIYGCVLKTFAGILIGALILGWVAIIAVALNGFII